MQSILKCSYAVEMHLDAHIIAGWYILIHNVRLIAVDLQYKSHAKQKCLIRFIVEIK